MTHVLLSSNGCNADSTLAARMLILCDELNKAATTLWYWRIVLHNAQHNITYSSDGRLK